MRVLAALPRMRQHAESLMTDTCRITRKGEGKGPWNDETGQYDDPPRTTIYEGAGGAGGICRIQVHSTAATGLSAGERLVTVQTSELQLPVAASANVVENDVAEILTAPYDASLVGRKFTVQGPSEKSQATMRRLRVVSN